MDIIQENSSTLMLFRKTGYRTGVETTGKSAHAKALVLTAVSFCPIKNVLGKCFSASVLYS